MDAPFSSGASDRCGDGTAGRAGFDFRDDHLLDDRFVDQ
jgi:hypothetical protein